MSRPRRQAIGASLALALGALVALASLAAPALAAGHAVAIRDSSFGPSSITIRKGDSITWTNRGGTNHNVTFDAFASNEQMEPGTKYSHTFRSAGTFRYTCTLHGFTGKVVVTGAATPKPTPRPASTAPPASQAAAPSGTPGSAAPTGSNVAVVPAPVGGTPPPGSDTGGPSAPASGTGGAPLVALVALVAAGLIALGVLARARR